MREYDDATCQECSLPAEVQWLCWLSWAALAGFLLLCLLADYLYTDTGLRVAVTVFATLPAVASLSLSYRAWRIIRSRGGTVVGHLCNEGKSPIVRRPVNAANASGSKVGLENPHPGETSRGSPRQRGAYVLLAISVLGCLLFLAPPVFSAGEKVYSDTWSDIFLGLMGLCFSISWGVMLGYSPVRFLWLFLGCSVGIAALGIVGILAPWYPVDDLSEFGPWVMSYTTLGFTLLGVCSAIIWTKYNFTHPIHE